MDSLIVLGLGGCLDHEVAWDAGALETLAASLAIGLDELDPAAEVVSERDLVRSVLGFMRAGDGGERFVADPELIEAFAARVDHRTVLGGTNVRAAVEMSRLGIPSTLHLVSVDERVLRLLPGDVEQVQVAGDHAVDPHLVVQFPAGALVHVEGHPIRAPRANRLIYVNDVANRDMPLSPGLRDVLADAAVFLVSGFNSMRDAALLETRLDELAELMVSLPADCCVVYEDAGFHLPGMNVEVNRALAHRVDVHSMNEDELEGYLGRAVDVLDAAEVLDALDDLQDVVPASTVVVHSAAWALAVGKSALDLGPALRAGTLTAGARYLDGDRVTAGTYERLRGARPHKAGHAVARELERRRPRSVRAVPAATLEVERPTTVGLGDSFVGGLLASLAGPAHLRDATIDPDPAHSTPRSCPLNLGRRRAP